GSIKRNVDPKTVPYEYGKCYSRDAFTPEIEANNSAEFCIRDMRGTSVRFFPFQYNPVAKQLKIYTEITAKVRFTKQQGENEIESNFTKIDEFEHIYARTFINYPKGKRYTQVQDGHPGRMLVVCADAYQEAMGDFISWKREKGIATEMALMSEIGTTSANLKTFIQNYFSSHDDLAYILLVGDGGAVPSIISGSAYEPETSDNKYVYLVGDDHYADVFIGRFSGESVEDIENQVRKVINYEKELTDEATWLTNAYGSASREGGGSSGHDQGYGAESDMVHTGYIQTKLENYGYTVTRVNQNSNYGYTSDVAATTAAFNNGIGVACYIGHGDYDRWYSTGYTISHVNALTNEYRLPFVISVACYNGEFVNKNCFGETWMRATNEDNPTGAIVFLGSSIAQDWNPPMTAQDEMIDIIVESDENNIKRTIGGITFNGYFKMIQDYPTSTNEGDGPTTADTWVVFG
ncbi:MAG: peptidase C25, partial [Bacteroidales bacterium]|nr:peptidase C25 [Bacteroidales bacterium]